MLDNMSDTEESIDIEGIDKDLFRIEEPSNHYEIQNALIFEEYNDDELDVDDDDSTDSSEEEGAVDHERRWNEDHVAPNGFSWTADDQIPWSPKKYSRFYFKVQL